MFIDGITTEARDFQLKSLNTETEKNGSPYIAWLSSKNVNIRKSDINKSSKYKLQ